MKAAGRRIGVQGRGGARVTGLGGGEEGVLVCVYVCVYVCMCVCARGGHTNTNAYTHPPSPHPPSPRDYASRGQPYRVKLMCTLMISLEHI